MWFNRKPVGLDDANPGLTGVEGLLRQADLARDDGDASGAAALYRSALALAPDRNDVKVQLGNMLKDTGKLQDAEALYREAQAADPGNSDICVQIGHVLKLRGNRTGALEQYRRAARIDPNSWAAAAELAEVGDSWQQQRRFDVQIRAGGAEAVMRMSRQIAEMRSALDEIAGLLPDALAQTAFPVDLYGAYRDLFDVPAPPCPSGPPVRFTVLLAADREPLDGLYAQLAALRGQIVADWDLLVIGGSAERQRMVTLAGAADPRIRWVEIDAGDAPAVAEWKAARAVGAGWLLLLGEGVRPHPHALGWFRAAAALGPAVAFVSDQDCSGTSRGAPVWSRPEFRQVVDYDTLLEANVFGETVAIEANSFAALLPAPPDGTVGRGRSQLLIDLARAGRVGHVPFALATLPEPRRLSLPEHRMAVQAHLARQGLADRVAVAKGETGPTLWRPQNPTTPLAVVIPTRDNDDDLRAFVASLREKAAVPDALRIVIIENGSGRSATRPLLEELAAKRYVTMLTGPQPFNWSALNNAAAAAVEAPHLVFANDDMLMLTDGWDARIRGLLERDDVGAVGARLLYGDDTLQHAGILFGWKGITIHDGVHEPADAPGPARRWQVTRATGAVTGAFLATRRERFLSLGGFDATHLPVAYSDIDYALKLREAGLKVLYTPSIALRHYESKTRGLDQADAEKKARNDAEEAVMVARWGEAFRTDPSLHPIWYQATLPFRLIAAPSAARVEAHVRRTAGPAPWRVERPGSAAAPVPSAR